MDRLTESARFLSSRRARLQPDVVGVVPYGGWRRVRGLRREEVAQLAGGSANYDVRLKQGRTGNGSEAVLDTVSRALQLDDQERDHLTRLARPGRRLRRPAPAPQRVRPSVHHLLDAMTDAIAFVVGRRSDVLAWKPARRSVDRRLRRAAGPRAQLRPSDVR
jgi:transcriptional regulator with XRE-family HTH domain